MRMKVDRNRGICQDFVRNIFDDCIDDHNELTLGNPAIKLLPRPLRCLPCLIIFLIRLEFIIRLIESACPILLLPNLDTLLWKNSEALSEIYVRLEAIICE